MYAYHRIYDLQWTPDKEQEDKFRRLLLIVIGSFLFFSVVMPWLPVAEIDKDEVPEIPQRFAKLVLEKQAPPPPPPPVVQQEPEPELVAEAEPAPAEPTPDPDPEPAPVEQARERASKAGLLPFADALADLRENDAVSSVVNSNDLRQGTGAERRSERSMITSSVASGSAGISTSNLSRDTGGGGLGGRSTTQVVSTLGGNGGGGGTGAGGGSGNGRGGMAGRSLEEIEMVFDRNKGAIFALYNRALRRDPTLQGKMVLKLTISPDGQVTFCEIVSSEIGDPELERKLVQRVKMFRFDPKDVAPFTATKPIDFFPA